MLSYKPNIGFVDDEEEVCITNEYLLNNNMDFSAIIEEIDAVVDEYFIGKVCIAGGMLLDVIQKHRGVLSPTYQIKDIDVFIGRKINFILLLNPKYSDSPIESIGPDHFVIKTSKLPIDVIKVGAAKTAIVDLLNDFDFTICKIAYFDRVLYVASLDVIMEIISGVVNIIEGDRCLTSRELLRCVRYIMCKHVVIKCGDVVYSDIVNLLNIRTAYRPGLSEYTGEITQNNAITEVPYCPDLSNSQQVRIPSE